MLDLQLVLFILMLAGAYATKTKLIDLNGRKYLTNLLIGLFLPCTIISSFDMEASTEILLPSLEVLTIAFAVQILLFLLGKILYLKAPQSKQVVMRFGTACSNSAFLGLPIIAQVMGAEAVLYGSIALIPLRLFMWTSGVSLFVKTSFRDTIKKLVIHPCIVAVYIGFFVLLAPFEFPVFAMNSIDRIGKCTTVASMLLIGSLLTEIKLKTIFDRYIVYFLFIRLVFVPVLIYLILRLLNTEPLIMGVTVIFAAMPAGTTTAVLAEKYGADSEFASKAVFATTLLSLVTIPLICMYLL